MKYLALILTLLALNTTAIASDAVDQLLQTYSNEGAVGADAERGKAFWYRDNAGRSCAGCHGEQVTQAGKHVKTGKLIEPMAPSVNSKSLTDVRQIEKWFYRNCKWTLGRECSAQEKADILTWLNSQ